MPSIGAVFGATKAATLMPTRLARDPESLRAVHRRLLALEPSSRRAVVVAEASSRSSSVAGVLV